MRHVVLYRKCISPQEDEREIQALQDAGFIYCKSRTEIQSGDLVIARYSCVPFYSELEADLKVIGAKLINSYSQHNYIADLRNWVMDLGEMTPKTWERLQDLPDEGSFVLKGGTNSRKDRWLTHCYAKDKQAAFEVYYRLCDDPMIEAQGIYIREYVPLFNYMTGVTGMPVTKEFRFFICDNKVLCGAYYWSNYTEELKEVPSIAEVPQEFLTEAMSRINLNPLAPRAYVLDVWIKADGQPMVGELNDLQMSGLSENDPFLLYKKLKEILDEVSNKSS